MINMIINTVTEKVVDYAYPLAGAVGSGLVAASETGGFLLWMTPYQWLETVLIIAIGALIGWGVKRFMDYCFPNKYKKKG